MSRIHVEMVGIDDATDVSQYEVCCRALSNGNLRKETSPESVSMCTSELLSPRPEIPDIDTVDLPGSVTQYMEALC